MTAIFIKVSEFFSSKEGATAIEYGLIAGGISLAIVAAVFFLGDELQALFESLNPGVQSIPAEVETSR